MHDDDLMRVLLHVQAHLDEPPDLASLAEIGGLSPAWFQRRFRAAVGESPRAYVERLRLERAAFRLRVHEDSVLTIALDSGYANHETFTRAFRRRFACSPRAFRAESRPAPRKPRESFEAASRYELGATHVRRRAPLTVAFLRHVGPYEDVPVDLFERVVAALDAAAIDSTGPRVGIAHDAPGLTPPDRLRFDAGVVVADDVRRVGGCHVDLLPAADVAVTTHAGPYATLPQAYGEIFARCLALPRWKVIGLPAVEIYQCERIDPARAVNHTDIHLPVARA